MKLPLFLPTKTSIVLTLIVLNANWMTVADAFCPTQRIQGIQCRSRSGVENSWCKSTEGTYSRFGYHPARHQNIMTLMSAQNANGSKDQEDDDTEKKEQSTMESGGVVAGLFGNLRIPASLVAGAALGSAFGLPLAQTDGLALGMVKRVYVLLMLGSMSSMLLTVLLSTLCMNDIALKPPRTAKSSVEYIKRYYSLEFMLARSNFLWGNIIFVIGSMMRGWVFLSCPKVARGVLGFMGSFILISSSIVLEYSKEQTGKSLREQVLDSNSMIWKKMKKSKMFALGTILWIVTFIYLAANVPHIAEYLIHQECNRNA